MSASTPQLTVIVRRFTARYRAALLRKAGLLAVLGAAILAVLGWRLSLLHLASWWSREAPMLAGLVAAGGLLWWMRRRWISPRSAPAFLDRTLGLQQRLITAEEFAAAQPPPTLYPLLMDDASSRTAIDGTKLPRPFDRTAAALAAVLVLLFVLPFGAHSPLQQLAQLPHPLRSPQPPPRVPPPEPPPDQRQQNHMHQQPQSGSGGQQQQGQSGSSQQQNASGAQGSGQGQQQQQSGGNEQGKSQEQASGQQSTASQRSGEQDGRAGQQQNASGSQGAKEQPSGASQDQNASAGQSKGQAGKPQPSSASQQSGQGGGSSPGNQEALKAEIQGLLKEVSGELKQLQSQLAAEQHPAPPSIGTNTDPELFEAPMALDPKTGQPVPINLQTDDAAVKDPRTGGGSGKPTGEVLSDAPQAAPEDAQLSETPLEEQTAGRQVVPPEYRNVFDRLNSDGTHSTTNEGTP